MKFKCQILQDEMGAKLVVLDIESNSHCLTRLVLTVAAARDVAGMLNKAAFEALKVVELVS